MGKNISKTLSLDTSSENVLTIYSKGDNSYNTITNLNRSDLNIKKDKNLIKYTK